MSTPLFHANERVYCTNCGAHVVTFSRDAFAGEAIAEGLFRQNEGQAPWRAYQLCACRKCGADWMEQLQRKGPSPEGLSPFQSPEREDLA